MTRRRVQLPLPRIRVRSDPFLLVGFQADRGNHAVFASGELGRSAVPFLFQ